MFDDEHLVKQLRHSGYKVELRNDRLEIKRKLKIPLFAIAYFVLFSLYLITSTPSTINISVGLGLGVVGVLVYYHNSITYLLLDTKASALFYSKGMFRTNYSASLNEVNNLELKTYDVPASASPFKKSNRDHIAEIRLNMLKGLPIDIISIEKDSQEDLAFVKTVFDKMVEFSGLKAKISKV